MHARSARRVLGLAFAGSALGLLAGLFASREGAPAIHAAAVALAAPMDERANALDVLADPHVEAPERVTPSTAAKVVAHPPPAFATALSGRVALRGGHSIPVSDASVRLRYLGKSEGDAMSNDIETIAVDETGSFRAEGLAFGRWFVICRAPGYFTSTTTVVLDEVRPHQSVDFELTGKRMVTLRLLDRRTGAPLDAERPPPADLAVLKPFACLARPEFEPSVGEPLPQGVSMDTLAFTRIEGRDPGWFDLALQSKGNVWVGATHAGTVVALVLVRDGDSLAQLVVDRERLPGLTFELNLRIVCAQTGSPVANAAVSVLQPPVPTLAAASDANGELDFPLLATDDPIVTIEAPGYLRLESRFPLRRVGAERQVVKLDQQRRIRGRIVDEDGVGVATRLLLVPENTRRIVPNHSVIELRIEANRAFKRSIERFGMERYEALPIGRTESTQSAADGSFELPAVRPDRYLLLDGSMKWDDTDGRSCAEYSGVAGFACVDTQQGSVDGIVLRRGAR